MRATSSPRATESVTPFSTHVAPRESVSPSIARNGAVALTTDAALQRPSSRRARRASGSDIAR